MIARTLFSLLNLVAMAGTIAAWFALPQYADYVLYAFIAWMIVGFVVLTSRWGNRPVGSSPRAAGLPAGAPLPSAATAPVGTPAAPGFCIFCGTDLAPGTGRCPACHRAVRPV
jgi:hypothetical protein